MTKVKVILIIFCLILSQVEKNLQEVPELKLALKNFIKCDSR